MNVVYYGPEVSINESLNGIVIYEISNVIVPTRQPLSLNADFFNVLYSIYTHLYTELYLILLIIYTGF